MRELLSAVGRASYSGRGSGQVFSIGRFGVVRCSILAPSRDAAGQDKLTPAPDESEMTAGLMASGCNKTLKLCRCIGFPS